MEARIEDQVFEDIHSGLIRRKALDYLDDIGVLEEMHLLECYRIGAVVKRIMSIAAGSNKWTAAERPFETAVAFNNPREAIRWASPLNKKALVVYLRILKEYFPEKFAD